MKLDKKKKSIISSIFLLIFMMSLCSVVYASSYTSTLAFKAPYSGATRSFDGQNIQYTASTYSDVPEYIANTYTVALYRKNFIGSSLIGKSKELKRDGTADVKWSNVGPGKYYLFFSKASDNIYVRSNKVIIRNY